jgi:hypothetical protein
MTRLEGLFSRERFASEISAVTLVMIILSGEAKPKRRLVKPIQQSEKSEVKTAHPGLELLELHNST